MEFTKNPSSNEVVLGRSGTYERIASERGSTFFKASDARWNEVKEMTGVGNNGMWRINKAFLDQQIAAGKTFVLANNPATDGGYFFAKEIAYLTKKGICYAFLQ